MNIIRSSAWGRGEGGIIIVTHVGNRSFLIEEVFGLPSREWAIERYKKMVKTTLMCPAPLTSHCSAFEAGP